jgi:drug/metabolite transporter (DMT)-like permease
MRNRLPFLYAFLAALLYGVSAPFSKILIRDVDPLFLASFLYLGAGIGMSAVSGIRKKTGIFAGEANLSRKDTAYVVLMILLDIAAPILLLLGLKLTNAATVSLLGNFEIVATALIAMIAFHEAVSRRLWLAIAFITSSCVVLSLGDIVHARISPGSVLVLLACLCWGFENNCTRSLSLKDPQQIVILKGFGSGFSTLAIAIVWGKPDFHFVSILYSMALGFVAYGLSITYYVKAQRMLGAARTSAFYAAAPFIGVVFSWLLLREAFTPTFLAALVFMCAGTYFVISEKHGHLHAHQMERHEHLHRHDDFHHQHAHGDAIDGHAASLEHSHEHQHEKAVHTHDHLPDPHHRHVH